MVKLATEYIIQSETEDKLIGKCQLLTRSEIHKKTQIRDCL